METEIKVETQGQTEEKTETAGTEAAAAAKEAAQEAAAAAGGNAETAEAAAETAAAAAAVSVEKAEQVENKTFSQKLEIDEIKSLLELQQKRIEQVFQIMETTAATVENLALALTTTLELNQEQIGTVDAAAERVVTATAALVKLHQQQTEAK